MVTNLTVKCVIPAYVMRQNRQMYRSEEGKNWVERWIRQRGAITIAREMIFHSYIPTVTHSSKPYSVQTAGKCNTPRFISSLVKVLTTLIVTTNRDFSFRLSTYCCSADIPLVVQTNWYCQQS